MKNKTYILFERLMKHILRSPDTIITVAITPIAIMLLFVYVLGGSVKAGIAGSTGVAVSDINYVNYLLPGILLMAIASGIAYTAMRLFEDMQKGLFSRFHSMPIRRSSVLWGHVLTSLVSNTITIILIFGVALIIGFRSGAGILNWLAAAGILLLFTLSLTWLAVIPGLSAKSMEGATAFSYPLIFLPMISSAFVPTETMPAAVRAFAEHQPVTSIVNAIRSLLNAEPVGSGIWIALAWCIGITAIAWFFAIRIYQRRA